MALLSVFHSVHSPDNAPLSHSVFPVLFLPYWSLQLFFFFYESLPQPLYNPLWLTGLKAPTKRRVRPLGLKKYRIKDIFNFLNSAVFKTLCFQFDTGSTILPLSLIKSANTTGLFCPDIKFSGGLMSSGWAFVENQSAGIPLILICTSRRVPTNQPFL